FVPGVQPLEPGLCAIRVRGPARYFGGEEAAARALIGLLADTGVPGVRAGIADGIFTAEQAARETVHRLAEGTRNPVLVIPPGRSAEFLAPLPVTALGDEELAELLPRLGVR